MNYIDDETARRINPHFGMSTKTPPQLSISRSKSQFQSKPKSWPTHTAQYYKSLISHLPNKAASFDWIVSGYQRIDAAHPSFMSATHQVLSGDIDECFSVLHTHWVSCSKHMNAETDAEYDASNICPICINLSKTRLWNFLSRYLRMIPDAYFVDTKTRTMYMLEIEDHHPVDGFKASKISDLSWWFDDMSWTLTCIMYYPQNEAINIIEDAATLLLHEKMQSAPTLTSSWLRAFNSAKECETRTNNNPTVERIAKIMGFRRRGENLSLIK